MSWISETVILNFDGRFDEEYDSGSISYILKSTDGEIIIEKSSYSKDLNSSTKAECVALLKGIEKTLELGYNKDIIIRGDCKNLIDAVKGNSSYSDRKTQQIVNKIINMIDDFRFCNIKYIPRDKNVEAHRNLI